MFEQTNQADVEIDNDGSDLFTEEQTNESQDAEQEDTEEMPDDEDDTESEEAAPQTAPTIRIKYNGEEMDLPLGEVTTLAQKGMNYDKIARERDELRNGLGEIDAWARQLGKPRGEILSMLAAQRHDVLAQSALWDVQNEFPDISDRAAMEIAKTRTAEKVLEEANKPWLELLQQYPNIRSIDDVPPIVVDDVIAGATPLEAMQRHEFAQMKRQVEEYQRKQAADAKNNDNRQRALGSAASKGAQAPSDAFLSGFAV